jgi:hypothetical protein
VSETTKEDFGRVELYDAMRERDVAFEGRKIATSLDAEQDAYLSAPGSIVVHDHEGVTVYEDWDALVSAAEASPDLLAQIAVELGEKYAEELNI